MLPHSHFYVAENDIFGLFPKTIPYDKPYSFSQFLWWFLIFSEIMTINCFTYVTV